MKLPEELQFMANARMVQKTTTARMDGRLCIITGATSGVGYHAARGLAQGGANLVLVCRNREKAAGVRHELTHLYRVDIDLVQADFSRLEDVRLAADTILADHPRIDVLINNAGVHTTRRTLTGNGIETVFCVNHLASFLFTRLLLDRLIESAPARIIQVNSQGHRFGGLDLEDLNWEKRRYRGLQGYGASKTAQLLTVWELADRLAGSGVTINAMHPGEVRSNIGMNNGLLYRWYKRYLLWWVLKDPEISGNAIYYLAAAPEMAAVSGKFFNQTIEEKPAAHALDRSVGRRIWSISEALTGLAETVQKPKSFVVMDGFHPSQEYAVHRGVNMNYDAIVVGGGMAGLTAAAYLAKTGYKTLLCEKESKCGGLVNTFVRDGFVFDGGIRAMENSGVVLPMLKQLGLEIEFVRNRVSIGIEDRVIRVDSRESIPDYEGLLSDMYPECRAEIAKIIARVREIMKYLDVQYGIDNPVFLDMTKDRGYLVRVILPWMFKYAFTVRKITHLNKPVVEYLQQYTRNQSLLDIITQHFFRNTPTFFALSYLSLYLDYYYPLGGTGKLVEELVAFIVNQGGTICTNMEIASVDPDKRVVTDKQGMTYGYRRLVWAADQKSLYRCMDPDHIAEVRMRNAVLNRRAEIADKSGNDSVYTLFLALDLDKSYFSSRASEHFFYTADRTGQSAAGPIPTGGDRDTIENWLKEFYALTTYEISCPVMRDSTLAPAGKTGLIVSVLFDYKLTKYIEQMGWYEEFKSLSETHIINTLNSSIYPGFKESILHRFSSTPLTMAKVTGNSDGAITGWAFANQPMPAENRLPRILNSIKTPIPGILQAGQWTFSPSGFPISILTGKLAADRVTKELGKSH